MIYNVAGLLTGKLGDSQQHEIENGTLVIDGHKFTKISGLVDLMRTDRTVLVTADLEAMTHQECSRCLTDTNLPVSVDFEEEFTPLNADLVDGPYNRTEDEYEGFDPALIVDEQNSLDMTLALGQALLGAMPIAPVCKDECLGICPTCTVNRNEIQCFCAKSTSDPRWAALAGLLEKGAESTN